MENVVVNLTGKIRHARLNGRNYLVAPLSMLVPGVLDGSDGPLYYPPEQVANSVPDWNHMPIVVYHPSRDGLPLSARSPDVLHRQGIGLVFSSTFKDKLTAEGWFDIEAMRRIDSRVLNALEKGEPIELSTGLGLNKTPAGEGAVYNGRPYTYETGNYKPDHLAVLPDQRGACSLLDGCGVLVNTNTPLEEEPTMDRKTTISWLVANCECWSGPEDAETLDKLSDDKLKQLKSSTEAGKQVQNRLHETEAVVNAVRTKHKTLAGNANIPDLPLASMVNFVTELPAPTVNTLPLAVPGGGGLNPALIPQAPTPMVPPTMDSWMAAMPEEAKAVWTNAVNIVNSERVAIAEQLTAHLPDEAVRNTARTALAKEPIDKLRFLRSIAAPAPQQQVQDWTQAMNFIGAGGLPPGTNNGRHPGLTGGLTSEEENDCLQTPVYNWGEQ